MAIAIALRFIGLNTAGIFGVDDGRYILDGYSKFVESKGLLEMAHGKAAELRGGTAFVLADALKPLTQSLQTHHPFSPKLGFTYLTALVMWTNVGFVSAASYVEATSGVLLVFATYILIRCTASARAAAIGAGVMALSPYAVYYSRNAYPQNTSALFIVAAVIVLVQTRESRRPAVWCGLSGLCLGIAFWIHYQAAAAIIAFAAWAIWVIVCARPSARSTLMQCASIVIGFAAICIFAEAITYPLVMLFRAAHLDYPHKTFFELLAPRLHSQLDLGWNPAGLLVMPYAFTRFHGIAGMVATLALGLWAFAARRGWRAAIGSRSFALFAIPAAAITLAYALKHGQVFRMYLFAFPFWAAGLGVIVDRLLRDPGRFSRPTAIIAMVVIAGSMVPPLIEIMRYRSAYPDALAYAREQNTTLVSGWSSTVEAYYLMAGTDAGDVFSIGNEISSGRYTYVADWQELYYGAYPDAPLLLSGNAPAITTFEHRFGRVFLEAELFYADGDPWREIQNVRAIDLRRAQSVQLFSLQDRPIKTAPH